MIIYRRHWKLSYIWINAKRKLTILSDSPWNRYNTWLFFSRHIKPKWSVLASPWINNSMELYCYTENLVQKKTSSSLQEKVNDFSKSFTDIKGSCCCHYNTFPVNTDQEWLNLYVAFTMMLWSANFCVPWERNSYYHSFSEPNVCLAWLQMDLCRAANIFAAR